MCSQVVEPVHSNVAGGAGVAASGLSLTPAPIIATTFKFAESCILLAAVELNLFTRIAQGKGTADLLAEDAQASGPALVRLLGALVAMGFLRDTRDGYTLAPISERFLVRGTPTYIGDVVLQVRSEWDAWRHLPHIVQSGQPARCIEEEPLGSQFFAPLADYTFPIVYPLARRICERLAVAARPPGFLVIDLGAGAAPGAIAVLEANPGARAVAVDFPGVLPRAVVHAERRGVASRLDGLPADLSTIELPEEAFDLALASHVLRILGAKITRRLLAQAFRTLRPGSPLVIVETYNDPDQADEERLFPHIVDLNMLVNTREGEALSSHLVREWLAAAGFRVEVWRGISPDLVLVAWRP